MSDHTASLRARWAAIGAAVAVALGGVSTALVNAAVGGSDQSAYVAITPCRLFDTRASETVGSRSTPLEPRVPVAWTAWGTNGRCTLPSNALAVTMNVTIVNPTAASYLTVWPSDEARPGSSSLNWVAGQAPTANVVTAKLSPTGSFSTFNFAGQVDVVADVTGYFIAAEAGPPGPEGAPGQNGADGASYALLQPFEPQAGGLSLGGYQWDRSTAWFAPEPPAPSALRGWSVDATVFPPGARMRIVTNVRIYMIRQNGGNALPTAGCIRLAQGGTGIDSTTACFDETAPGVELEQFPAADGYTYGDKLIRVEGPAVPIQTGRLYLEGQVVTASPFQWTGSAPDNYTAIYVGPAYLEILPALPPA